jgi:hypothetical protein
MPFPRKKVKSTDLIATTKIRMASVLKRSRVDRLGPVQA